jgi:gas vesicle protein
MSNTESDHTGHTGKVIGALLVGTVIGAGLALLFAPDSGSETQKKIMDELKDAFGGIKDKIKSHQCPQCGHKQEEEPAKQA